jgi:hypothetical protein
MPKYKFTFNKDCADLVRPEEIPSSIKLTSFDIKTSVEFEGFDDIAARAFVTKAFSDPPIPNIKSYKLVEIFPDKPPREVLLSFPS